MNKLNERTMQPNDLHRTDLFVVNGCVCDYRDYFGNYPSVNDIRCSWRLQVNGINDRVSDEEILEIILLVKRFDGMYN